MFGSGFKRATGFIGGAMVAAAIGIPVVVGATPPPTLSGEFLSALPAFNPSATVEIVADCDPDGTSTISWSASGEATALFGTAPYPGTFVETGMATIGVQDGGPGFVNGIALGLPISVEVFFAIDSPVGQVIGTKRLTGTTTFRQGACRDLEGFVLPDGSIATGTYRRVAVQWGAYEALIITDTGAYLDSGDADTFLEHYAGTTMAEIDSVQESFRSGLSAVVPAPGGRATGGGRVGDASFGFTAQSDKSGPKGRCALVDAPAEVTIKCLDVGIIGVIGSKATITGNALFNDVAVRYRIVTVDADESGAGVDSWSISLSNGYATGGTLTEGNIQVAAK